MKALHQQILSCNICMESLPHAPNPIVQFSSKSKIAIIGQAPGRVVHETMVPWNDNSGKRLRKWLGVSREQFYNTNNFAIVPMGFCYPGKGKGGDLPPRKECAPQWHHLIFNELQNIKIKILIGSYAQKYYLKDRFKGTLTETVRSFEEYLPQYIVLPHPSPRNVHWFQKNAWMEDSILPLVKSQVQNVLH